LAKYVSFQCVQASRSKISDDGRERVSLAGWRGIAEDVLLKISTGRVSSQEQDNERREEKKGPNTQKPDKSRKFSSLKGPGEREILKEVMEIEPVSA
jgi:hypothetical protein